MAEYGDGPLYAEQVYEVLKKGASAKTSAGEKVTLEAQEGVEPQQTRTAQASQTADYSGATWYGHGMTGTWRCRTRVPARATSSPTR